MKKTRMGIIMLCGSLLYGCINNQNQGSVNTGSGDIQQTQTASGPQIDVTVNLNLNDWYAWGGIHGSPNGNTVTLNGRINTAGYVSDNLDRNILRNKTVTLEIKNTEASEFSDGRLIKITVNKEDRLVQPLNVSNLVHGEYVPESVKRIEFTLPNDFDGKLSFVFYQADLKNLQITVTYR